MLKPFYILIVICSLLAGFVFYENQKETPLGAPSSFVVSTSTGNITSTFSNGTATTTIQAASSTFAGRVNIIGTLNTFGQINASSTATSTLANGLRLYGGCYQDASGSCLGSTALTGVSLTKGFFLVGDDAGLSQATNTIFVSSSIDPDTGKGKIGIGTTTPVSPLAVALPASATLSLRKGITLQTVGTAYWSLGLNNTGDFMLDAQTGTPFNVFQVINNGDGTAAFTLTSSLTLAGSNPNATIPGNLMVDTNTLFVDSSTNRTGVGTGTPGAMFSVQGNSVFSGNLTLANLTSTGTIAIQGTGTSTITDDFDVADNLEGGRLNITGSATSTFANGIQLSAGCFMKQGSCLTEISSSLTGILEEAGGVVGTVSIGTGLDYTGTTLSNSGVISNSCSGGLVFCSGTNPSSFTGSSTPTFSNFFASSTSNSLLAGGLLVGQTSGSLGVGTSTPATLLSVQGNGLFSGTLTAANFRSSSNTPLGGLSFDTGVSTGTVFMFKNYHRAVTLGKIDFKLNCPTGNCTNYGIVLNVRHASDMGNSSTTANTLTSATIKVTSTSTIQSLTSGFNDNTVAAGESIWIHVTDASSSPNSVGLYLQVLGTYD